MNIRELIKARLKPEQELRDPWGKHVRNEFATQGARTVFDTMTPNAYMNVPDGNFERRFCGVLVVLIWAIMSFVIMFALVV